MNFSFCHVGSLLLVVALARPASAVELGVRDGRFLLDGQPAFLVGVSYYGALGADEAVVGRDLDELARRGFRWMRVWATWNAFGRNVSAVDGNGRARQPYLDRLARLVAEGDRRGLVVDVTLARGSGAPGALPLRTLDAHRRAVETIIDALKERRNWYLDLANERNIGDERFVSIEDLRDLRAIARRRGPSLLVTASHGGDIDRDALVNYVASVGLDFVAPHRPRDGGSPARTEAATHQLRSWMREMGRVVPIQYQEPFRRGYGPWAPSLDDFLRDRQGAERGGAAGWCFHNGDTQGPADRRPRRSFDLTEKGLFAQLDDVELAVVDGAVDRR